MASFEIRSAMLQPHDLNTALLGHMWLDFYMDTLPDDSSWSIQNEAEVLLVAKAGPGEGRCGF